MRAAFASEIKIYDDDNELIGTLKHDCDDIYLFHPSGNYNNADDYMFVAKVLNSQLCNLEVTDADEG